MQLHLAVSGLLLWLAASSQALSLGKLPPLTGISLELRYQKGDILKVSRCYCASPNCAEDHVLSFFTNTTYYNIHTDHHYTAVLKWISDPIYFASDHACLELPHSGEKVCSSDEKGNQFCYKFNGGYRDDFYFNKQHRRTPKEPTWWESTEHVEYMCNEACKTIWNHDVLKGEALTDFIKTHDKKKQYDWNWNVVEAHEDIDDMCDGCR